MHTEAEWEYAARGGNQSLGYKYAGSDNPDVVAWYANNSNGQSQSVGQKQANELGIYDMSGNVYEWCWDWYGTYSASSQSDPTGPISGTYRLLRGGSWYDYVNHCRVANRNWHDQSYGNPWDGFRLVYSQD